MLMNVFRKMAQLPSSRIHNHRAKNQHLLRSEKTPEEVLDGNGDDPVPRYGRHDFDRNKS
jgi:hypothetical protein